MSNKCPINASLTKGCEHCGNYSFECENCYYWKQKKSYFYENMKELNSIKSSFGLNLFDLTGKNLKTMDAIEKIEKIFLTLNDRMEEFSDMVMKEKQVMDQIEMNQRWFGRR